MAHRRKHIVTFPKYCSNCGNTVISNSSFCSSCGNNIGQNFKPKATKDSLDKGTPLIRLLLTMMAFILTFYFVILMEDDVNSVSGRKAMLGKYIYQQTNIEFLALIMSVMVSLFVWWGLEWIKGKFLDKKI